MVQVHRSYYDGKEPALRRYNRNTGHGYAIGHEREIPHGPYEGHAGRDHLSASHHDSRGGSRAPEAADNSRPRSRIQVACGRCRQRKIRCSGENPNGWPCTNCKGCGADTCQFLRVSSLALGVQMRKENVDFSNYDTHSNSPHSRLQSRTDSSYGSHATPYMSPSAQIPEGYYAGGRATVPSGSGYQFPTRYFGLAPFNDYSEDNVIDYSAHNTNNSYQLMGSDHHLLSTSLSAGSGRWPTQATQATQVIKPDPSLYLSSYTMDSQIPSQSAYQLRPQMVSDVKDTSLAGSSIHSMPVPDRVLPVPSTSSSATSVNRSIPVANRTTSSSYARVNSTESSSVSQNPNEWHQYDGEGLLAAAQALSTVKNLPQSDSHYIYASSPESLSSSQATFQSSQSLSSSTQNELYTTNSSDMFHGNESTESPYGPSSSSQRDNANSSEGSMSNVNSNLVNGQSYVLQYSQPTYTVPPTRFTQNESRLRTKAPSAPVGIST